MPPRWFPGGPPGDEPLGGARGERGVFNPIARLPQWMRNALRLTTDEVPKRVRVDQVIANIDLGQQGWGYADYLPVQTILASASGVIVPAGLDFDETVVRRLLYIDAEVNSVASSLILNIETPALGLVGGSVITRVSETALLATPEVATSFDITQGLPITIPPGSRFSLDATGLAALEFLNVEMVWARFPAGFPLPV